MKVLLFYFLLFFNAGGDKEETYTKELGAFTYCFLPKGGSLGFSKEDVNKISNILKGLNGYKQDNSLVEDNSLTKKFNTLMKDMFYSDKHLFFMNTHLNAIGQCIIMENAFYYNEDQLKDFFYRHQFNEDLFNSFIYFPCDDYCFTYYDKNNPIYLNIVKPLFDGDITYAEPVNLPDNLNFIKLLQGFRGLNLIKDMLPLKDQFLFLHFLHYMIFKIEMRKVYFFEFKLPEEMFVLKKCLKYLTENHTFLNSLNNISKKNWSRFNYFNIFFSEKFLIELKNYSFQTYSQSDILTFLDNNRTNFLVDLADTYTSFSTYISIKVHFAEFVKYFNLLKLNDLPSKTNTVFLRKVEFDKVSGSKDIKRDLFQDDMFLVALYLIWELQKNGTNEEKSLFFKFEETSEEAFLALKFNNFTFNKQDISLKLKLSDDMEIERNGSEIVEIKYKKEGNYIEDFFNNIDKTLFKHMPSLFEASKKAKRLNSKLEELSLTFQHLNIMYDY